MLLREVREVPEDAGWTAVERRQDGDAPIEIGAIRAVVPREDLWIRDLSRPGRVPGAVRGKRAPAEDDGRSRAGQAEGRAFVDFHDDAGGVLLVPDERGGGVINEYAMY